MQICVLDENPIVCAQYHNNKHVVKLIVEYAQLMSSAHHAFDTPIKDQVYRKTHFNHPLAKWVRASKDNYSWIYELFLALSSEYTYRYEKNHKTFREKAELLSIVPDLPDIGLTEFVQCMPECCKVEGDAVTAYRKFYHHHKSHIGYWKRRAAPGWWNYEA